jgi:hypothetical protein
MSVVIYSSMGVWRSHWCMDRGSKSSLASYERLGVIAAAGHGHIH